jgi:hypothetical protein
MKSIVAQFNVVDFTPDKYDKTIKDLQAAGQGSPRGRLYHIITKQDKGMLVTDVWESEETLNEFSKTLIPILQKNGVTPAKPTLLPVYNIIK